MSGGAAAVVGGLVALGIAATAPVSIPLITAVGAVTAVTGGVAASAGGAAIAVGATYSGDKDGQGTGQGQPTQFNVHAFVIAEPQQ